MTRREAIMNDIKTRLATIKTTNSYLTNIGNYVSHWSARIKSDSTNYVFDIRDISNEHDNSGQSMQRLYLEIFVAYKANSLTESAVYSYLNKAIQDIYSCLMSYESTLFAKYDYARFYPQSETINIGLEDTFNGEAEIKIELIHSVQNYYQVDTRVWT
jgi:hypothetical protein